MIKTLLTLAFFLSIVLIASAQPNLLPKPRHRFTVIAHRGDHVIYPENTLAAYQEAIKDGADYVEIDLRTTRDSVLVIMHDGSVTRTTGTPGNVKDLTLAQIRELQVKSRDTTDRTLYRVPTFAEVLRLCRNKIYIYLDYKDASVSSAYRMLRKYGMEKQVIVYINSEAQRTEWRRIAPRMPLMLSLPDSTKSITAIKAFIDQTLPDILDGDWKDYNDEVLNYLKTKLLMAWPDIQSIKEDQNWDAALSLGFNGLQTDHPAALIKFLIQKGVR